MPKVKFKQIKILLRTRRQVESLLSIVPHLPLDESHPLEVVIREEVKGRGFDANAYYWLRLGEIAEQAWFNGRQYISDVWHEYCKRHIMPDEITTKDGEIRSKWTETPDGELTVISTTVLEKSSFHEYTTAVEAFGASLGVKFSANPRDRYNQ